jgi:hypothetical protein
MEINKQVEKLLEGARYIAKKEDYPKDASIYYHEDDVENAIIKALSITAVVQAKPEVCEHERVKHNVTAKVYKKRCLDCGADL